MRQTTTIQTKIQEEKKQRGFDSTSKSLISEIKRSHSRPVTPTKSTNNIPFIEDSYLRSPMRTRNKIPRTPNNGTEIDEGNDFKNDDNSQLDISIGASQNLGSKLAPNFGGSKNIEETKVITKEKAELNKKKAIDAFNSKDKIPRSPPHLQSKKYEVAPPVSNSSTKPTSRKVNKKKI